MTPGTLPREVQVLLRLTLPGDWRDDIVRDLEEWWVHRRGAGGRAGARLHLWVQALGFSLRFLPVRVKEGFEGTAPTSTDIRLAMRSAARAPLVAALAVVSLAFGIGAALTGFTLFRGILADLPYPGGDRIMLVQDYDIGNRLAVDVGVDEFLRRRDGVETFEYFEAFTRRSLVVGEGDGASLARVYFATPGFLALTEVSPVLGRLPDEADARPGAEPVVVLPYGAWVRLMGSDPGAVGRRVLLGGEARTVIGVMPADFAFPWAPDYWVPVEARNMEGPVGIVGKLRPEVGLATARADLASVARPDRTQVAPDALVRHLVTPLTRPLTDDRQIYVAMIPVVVLVLLLVVMATNVANLVLARNADRSAELAIRSALGASRRRIVGQLALEVGVMVAVAAAAGVALAWLTLGVVDNRIALPLWTDLSIGVPSVAFAAALGGMVTFVAGVMPALRATGRAPGDALRARSRGGTDVRFGRLVGGLIVLQITISVAFLSMAALLGRSLLTLGFEGYGLPGDETLVAQISAGWPTALNDPGAGLSDLERAALRESFLEQAEANLRRIRAEVLGLPGVIEAAYGSRFPGNESEQAHVLVESHDDVPRAVEVADAGGGYFTVLGARIVSGRAFTDDERSAGLPVVIVNEPFVRDRLAGAPAVGRRIRLLGSDRDPVESSPWATVVGVVPDLGHNPANPGNAAVVYRPLGAAAVVRLGIRVERASYLDGMTARLVRLVREVDPAIQVQGTQTLAGQMREPVLVFRVAAGVALLLGVLALVLAAASLHALTACAVTRRTAEIGVRKALGAGSGRILQDILRRSLVQLAAGLVLGTALTLGLVRQARDFPWDIRQGDPLAVGAVALILAVSAVAALFRPSRRVLAIRPTDAMRSE